METEGGAVAPTQQAAQALQNELLWRFGVVGELLALADASDDALSTLEGADAPS